MKKQLCILATILLMAAIESKSQNAQQANPILAEMISPLQAGTATLINGKALIKIDERVAGKMEWDKNLSYIVMLTPYNDCGQVIISEKNSGSFVISQACNNQTGNTATCDYIVYLKETAQTISEK